MSDHSKNNRGPWSTRRKDGKPREPSGRGGDPNAKTVDTTNWRQNIRDAKRIKFDDEAKALFVRHFAEFGQMTAGAKAAGVCYNTVRHHMDIDPEFYQAVEDAKAEYRDLIFNHHRNLCLEGVSEPILGGKFKDEVVAYKRVFPIPLIQMELKKVDPAYRDKQEIDMNVSGGVLAVPSEMSASEWAAKYGGQKPDSASDEAEAGGEGS